MPAVPIARAASGADVTPADRADIDEFKSKLAAKFHGRRCWCGCQAVVVFPGQKSVREAGILLKRAKRDRNLCMAHAGLLSNERVA